MRRALSGSRSLLRPIRTQLCSGAGYSKAASNLFVSRTAAADAELRSSLHSERKQRLLAGIAAAAAATYVVATHVQQAPISGRLQLILQWPGLLFPSVPESQTSSASMPKIWTALDRYHSGDRTPEQRLSAEGYQLTRATYTQLASAVDKLANSNPTLQRYLCRLQGKVSILHRTDHLDSPIVCTIRPLPARLDESTRHHMLNSPTTKLSVAPGNILQLQSADELVSTISRAVAPLLLQHSEERSSWNTINAWALPALLAALRAGRVRWSASLLLGTAFWQAASTVINTWLPRQQEYEADEVACMLSTAAGCSPNSMLTALQRAYCASQTSPHAVRGQLQRSNAISLDLYGINDTLKAASASIPSDLSQGSTAIQQIRDAAAKETERASTDRRVINMYVDWLDGELAEELCAIRSPWNGLTSPHVHLLDRIARMEQRLRSANSTGSETTQQLASDTGFGCCATPAREDLQKQLSAYQTSAAWPILLQQESIWHVQPRHRLDSFAAVRAMSAEALNQQVQAEAQKEYSWSVYRKALKLSWRQRHMQA